MTHHRRGLRRLLGDQELAARAEKDHSTAGLDARRRAMLDYAEKLTRAPSSVTEGDVKALREHGLSDEDIVAVAEVTAYFAFANRIADGLGVEIEDV